MKQSHKERWAHLGAEELSVGIKDFAGDAKEHARWAARAQETADSLRKELRRRKRERRPMDRERYNLLNLTGVSPSPEERAEGWHYCCEWDQLLIGPGMPETECCTCPIWLEAIGKSTSAEPVRSEASEVPAVAGPES